MSITLQQRFRGCLIGLAIGDALGGRFEAQSSDHIRRRFPSAEHLIDYVTDDIWYTDDTQMAIGVSESLAEHGEIVEERLCQAFVDNYTPSRGYGLGARKVLEAMGSGGDYKEVAAGHFPGGSYGNGAAMRVAPIGIFFRDEPERVIEQSRLSAIPTHVHPLGIEGAQLIAIAVAEASKADTFDRGPFFSNLLSHCNCPEFRSKLEIASTITDADDLLQLGNGIEAVESVATAIACFALTPNSYVQTITNAIFLGGDTDTIAAMAGAISGAMLGIDAIPSTLFDHLEKTPKGRAYIVELADRLHASYANRCNESD